MMRQSLLVQQYNTLCREDTLQVFLGRLQQRLVYVCCTIEPHCGLIENWVVAQALNAD